MNSIYRSKRTEAERKGVPELAISIRDIVKNYGNVRALDGVSFDVPAGEFFGFLGPNGAGKTTTISAIMGLVKLHGGKISLFGHDTVSDWRAARRVIGLAPQEYNFDRYLSIRDILLYQAGYYGLRRDEVSERADALLERFDLTGKADEPYQSLSGGMKRRLTLARALMHSPKILILDEPTAGVDVELRIELWQFLRELNSEGMTIFLTTHYLDEAEALCNRIGIIDHGKLVALEATPRLLELAGETRLTIRLDRPVRALPHDLEMYHPRMTPGSRTILFDNAKPVVLSRLLFSLEAAGLHIDDVSFERPSLQDVFLTLTKRTSDFVAKHEAPAQGASPMTHENDASAEPVFAAEAGSDDGGEYDHTPEPPAVNVDEAIQTPANLAGAEVPVTEDSLP